MPPAPHSLSVWIRHITRIISPGKISVCSEGEEASRARRACAVTRDSSPRATASLFHPRLYALPPAGVMRKERPCSAVSGFWIQLLGRRDVGISRIRGLRGRGDTGEVILRLREQLEDGGVQGRREMRALWEARWPGDAVTHPGDRRSGQVEIQEGDMHLGTVVMGVPLEARRRCEATGVRGAVLGGARGPRREQLREACEGNRREPPVLPELQELISADVAPAPTAESRSWGAIATKSVHKCHKESCHCLNHHRPVISGES